MKEHTIPAYWYLSNNFGDSVTHYLIEKISGKVPVWNEPLSDAEKVVVTGSILNNEIKNASIWGAGIAFSNDTIPFRKNYLAVRGRLTHQKVIESLEKWGLVGAEIAIGDPVMLLPRYYNPKVNKIYPLGIIPHYAEAYELYRNINQSPDELLKLGVKIIDINLPVERFVDELKSCENILSSTLHGIIAADAYGIPSARFAYTNKIGGDGFKYDDWFSNFNDRSSFITLPENEPINLMDILSSIPRKDLFFKWIDKINIDIDYLYEKCPFKP